MVSTAQVRRMANVFGLALHAGTDGERASACNTLSNMMQRLGYDSSKEEDLVRLMDLGLNGQKKPNSDSADDPAVNQRLSTAIKVKEWSKEELSHHEGINHPTLIRILAANAQHTQALSQLEVAQIKDMQTRTPRRIHLDEWAGVEEMLRKMGLTKYTPTYDQVD